jgi:hypothetical protein
MRLEIGRKSRSTLKELARGNYKRLEEDIKNSIGLNHSEEEKDWQVLDRALRVLREYFPGEGFNLSLTKTQTKWEGLRYTLIIKHKKKDELNIICDTSQLYTIQTAQ